MTRYLQDEIVLEAIKENDVSGYRVFRSPTNHTRFNVVAVNGNDNPLFVLAADLSLDEAMFHAEEQNKILEGVEA